MKWKLLIIAILAMTAARSLQSPTFSLSMMSSSTMNVVCAFDELVPKVIQFSRRTGEHFDTVFKVEKTFGDCLEYFDKNSIDIECTCIDGNSVSCNVSFTRRLHGEDEWRCAKFKDDTSIVYSNAVTVPNGTIPPSVDIGNLSESTVNLACSRDETYSKTFIFSRRSQSGRTFDTVFKVSNIDGECSIHMEVSLGVVQCTCISGNSVTCNMSYPSNSNMKEEWQCATFNRERNRVISNAVSAPNAILLPILDIVMLHESSMSITCYFKETSPTSTLFDIFEIRRGGHFESVLKVNLSKECGEIYDLVTLDSVTCVCEDGSSVSCNISYTKCVNGDSDWRCVKFNADKSSIPSNVVTAPKCITEITSTTTSKDAGKGQTSNTTSLTLFRIIFPIVVVPLVAVRCLVYWLKPKFNVCSGRHSGQNEEYSNAMAPMLEESATRNGQSSTRSKTTSL